MGELRKEIEKTYPNEEGGFLLARVSRTKTGYRLVADEYVSPPEGKKWRLQNQGQLAPTTDYMSRTASRAYRTNKVPIFLHTHPGDFLAFSDTDEWAHEEWVPFFLETTTQHAFASLILSNGEIIGDLWVGNQRIPITSITTTGKNPHRSVRKIVDHRWDDHREPDDEEHEHDRQERLWKERGQTMLHQSRVAIVGAGGTGSPMAFMLARAGVGELVLIDHDESAVSNLNRLWSLTPQDAKDHTPKVSVVAKRLKAETPDIRVRTHQQNVLDPGILPVLLECDVLVGCTDSHQSRSYLNQLSVLYGIPYIDLGCKAETNGKEILGLWIDVRRVSEGGPCLWCMGVLDSDRIAQEGLPAHTRERSEREGYVRGRGIEPSVITMTTSAAALGANQALALLLNQEIAWNELVILDTWTGTKPKSNPNRDPDCMCSSGAWRPEGTALHADAKAIPQSLKTST